MKEKFVLKLILSIALFFILAFSSFGGTTYYVSSSGNDGLGGLSWTDAKATIGAAITSASNGDIIEIGAGTFSNAITVNKRLTIIGAGKTGTGATTIGGTVTLNAPTSGTVRIILKNLAVNSASGNGIDLQESYVTLENVATKGTTNGLNCGITGSISNILIESCELKSNPGAGIQISSNAGIDGFTMRNTDLSDNGNYALSVPQASSGTPEFKNVNIKNCTFGGSNIGTKVIYLEKIKDAVFENVTISAPLNNANNAMDFNLKYRTDYGNITVKNSRVYRGSAISHGIYIKGRTDYTPPAAINGVTISGVVFNNCYNNIIMEDNVTNVVVEKCDLNSANHSSSGWGIANYSATGTLAANNNYWGGNAPVRSYYAVFAWANNSTTLNLVAPATTNINVNDYVYAASGISFGARVTTVNPGSVIINIPTTAIGAGAAVAFNPYIPPIGDILTLTTNPATATTHLTNPIVNDSNSSYASLAAAITGTSSGGTIYNIPAGAISGTTTIDKSLTLVSPGAGSLDASSLTTFQNLTINGGNLTMGSDFAISGILNNSNAVGINGYTLSIDGTVSGSGTIIGSSTSKLTLGGGSGGAIGTLYFDPPQSLFSLIFNRTGSSPSVIFGSDITTNYLKLTSGIINTGVYSITLNSDRIMGGSSSSYLNGKLKLNAEGIARPDLFFPLGSASEYFPITVNNVQQSATSNYIGTLTTSRPPNYKNRTNIFGISNKKYWTITPSANPSGVASVTIGYGSENLGTVADRRVVQYQTGTSAWTNIGPNPGTASPMTSNGTVSNELGNFCLGSTSAASDIILTVVSSQGITTPPAGDNYYTTYTLVAASVLNPIIDAGEGARYLCTGHSGTGSAPSGSETNFGFSLFVDSTLTWNWQLQYQLTITTSPDPIPAGCSVTPTSGGWYDSGASVQLEAASAVGSPHFIGWTGDVTSSDNPLTVTMDGKKNIIANFGPPNTDVKDWKKLDK